ncbi:sarcosine oxidase subunit delta [Pseudooceanicola aestuarii]|uniref:sarcosine oxidase subunit delta n=1 Tax=Pseudooceanicola aestuarii TaxID=2697319 RepID=UPI0013D4BB71|nr:sarcosine oxidase subunit delta [Pseudooceanicola aestuarii]
MRLSCPFCGTRDRREFTYGGAALARPDGAEWGADWDAYLHLRDNPAGVSVEYWVHAMGCGAWLRVTRDTVTHAVQNVVVASGEGAA